MDDFLFNFRNDVSVDFSPGVSPTVTLTATRELTKDVADLIAEINGIKNYNSESLKSILNRKDNKMNNANPHMDIVDYTYTVILPPSKQSCSSTIAPRSSQRSSE